MGSQGKVSSSSAGQEPFVLSSLLATEDLTTALAAVFCFCLFFYLLTSTLRPAARRASRGFGSSVRRVLLVTAHPDDETMFFGPTIVSLAKQTDVELMLLCLSYGNYRKEGAQRKQELYRACKELGMKEENITILNYTRLRDDPSVRWREELVSEVVQQAVSANDVDTVVTFDRGGVSGHKNHTSIHNALTLLCLEKRLPPKTRVFCLRSTNLLLKYSLVLDLPLSFLLAPALYQASISDWWRIQRAMACHRSQYLWFRKLYMAFSRYVLINTYDQLVISGTR